MVIERQRPGWEIIPWRPFRELEDFERRFENIFDHSFLPIVWKRLPTEEIGWAPAIEVFEKDDKFVVKAELPGLKEEDIDVSVSGDILTIKGERKAENEVKEGDYYCCERSYGSFSRLIALPSSVDADGIEASYENGVLEASLPKATEVKPKKISLSTNNKKKTKKTQ